MKDRFTFVYTADLHGNRMQYTKALDCAAELKRTTEAGLDAVIIGGDIAPKEGNEKDKAHWHLNHETRNPEAQRRFYEEFMIPVLGNYTSETRIAVYVMMGNDDFRINMGVLERASSQGAFKLLHERVHTLPNGMSIVGESFTDLTPFNCKDWEKHDTTDPKETRKSQKNTIVGYTSNNDVFNKAVPEGRYFRVDYSAISREDSLENHLFNVIRPLSDPGNTIYVIHPPPFGTAMSMMKGGIDVGSSAVRKFLEEVGGRLGLFAHIHEFFEITREYQDIVGKTIVAAPGNDPFLHPSKNYTNYSPTVSVISGQIKGDQTTLHRVQIT